MTREIALHCMKSASELEKELCEECPIYGQTGSDHCFEGALQYVIRMLEQEPSEDAISRQAAIDAFGLSEKTRKYGGDHSGYDTMMLYEIQDILDNLPPVTPAPKTGHWIRVDKTKVKCSECDITHFIAQYPMGEIKHCPNCGARMDEPQESEGIHENSKNTP